VAITELCRDGARPTATEAERARITVLYDAFGKDATMTKDLGLRGARLRYHGDFDWAGLVIGNFVMRAFGGEPWRFRAADYLSATADHRIALRGDKPVVARWDDRLTSAMSERRIVVLAVFDGSRDPVIWQHPT
jgi:hypothetical protein